MRQQLGEARIAKPRQMQAMLVHGAGDDGIHFAGQRESDGLPHGLACDLAGLFGEQGAGMMGVADDDNLGIERTDGERSEEHTSELQSQSNLVCRLLLEKKKNNN